jgi:hypothetical protein
MRHIVLTLLLGAGATAGVAAQQAATPSPPRQASNLPPGFLPEPAVVGRAADRASRLFGGESTPADGTRSDSPGGRLRVSVIPFVP